MIVLLAKYCAGDQIKNEIGEACGKYGDEAKQIQDFVVRSEGKRRIA